MDSSVVFPPMFDVGLCQFAVESLVLGAPRPGNAPSAVQARGRRVGSRKCGEGRRVAEDLVRVDIQKVIGPSPAGAAVLLGNDEKSFVVFIGMNEALALRRELKNEQSQRPLTHDLLQSVLLGFDLGIRQIVITRIIENAFCATLILEQKVAEKNGDWAGRRNEVRIDARPSDCLILALKNRSEIQVTREVFDQVQDVSHMAMGDLALDLPAGVDPDLLSLEPDPDDSEREDDNDDE